MGLFLNYDFRLPATASDDDADRVLAALHAFAERLPFDEVTPFERAVSTTREGWGNDTARTESWLCYWASMIATPMTELGARVEEEIEGQWVPVAEDEVSPLRGDVETARGFIVNAGEGCETATFGLLRRIDPSGARGEWYWQAWCKTQYASVVSDAHLVACHTSLVALLDHAIANGMSVEVTDETHYWETRDEQRLITEVGAMNRLVASLAGRVSDSLGAQHSVEAPIFEHPLFERLEMGEDDQRST